MAKRTNIDFSRFFRNVRTFMRKCKNPTVHMPRGNSKTGEIPAWNLLPGVTCPPEACKTCMLEGCYAIKNAIRSGYDPEKSSVLRAWCENTIMAREHLDVLEIVLDGYFTGMNAPRYFRIHASGDFDSIEYALMWYRTAQKHNGTRFLAFTKNWEVAREIPFDTLENFELVLSGWTGIEIPEDLKKRYCVAYCDDGESEIPEDALECPGHCDSCGMCWNLSKIGKDVRFKKH